MNDLKEMGLNDIVSLLETGDNCIVYGPNNSGKTTLLKDINEFYIQKNIRALFSKESSLILPCVMIPAKRVFELQEGGVLPNKDSLTIDIVESFRKEWAMGSYILGIREKIKQSPLAGKVSLMCKTIFEAGIEGAFDTKCSDGVQNIVNVLSYIFHVLTLFNNGSFELPSLLQTRFLLIIDEVELYLYTKSIVNFLEELFSTFKNMRMLISSHSVLVMQRLNNFHVLKISSKNSFFDMGLSPYFHDFGTILDSFYDVKEYPPELEDFMEKLDCVLRGKQINKSELKPLFEEACNLRSRYPILSELITDLQMHFYKRIKQKCNI